MVSEAWYGRPRVPWPGATAPMTEPLLTIDEATRAFRTSPKTTRGRLASVEPRAPYKRPGLALLVEHRSADRDDAGQPTLDPAHGDQRMHTPEPLPWAPTAPVTVPADLEALATAGPDLGRDLGLGAVQPRTLTVAAGDTFWSIASDVLPGSGEPSAAATAAYWGALLDANGDRLGERGNPDLLHVGQVLVLPPAR